MVEVARLVDRLVRMEVKVEVKVEVRQVGAWQGVQVCESVRLLPVAGWGGVEWLWRLA
jgi:hypothetical protein